MKLTIIFNTYETFSYSVFLLHSVLDIYLCIVSGVVVIYMEFVYIRSYKKNNLNIINRTGDGRIIHLILIPVCYKKKNTIILKFLSETEFPLIIYNDSICLSKYQYVGCKPRQ